jgi:hypothetical protein
MDQRIITDRGDPFMVDRLAEGYPGIGEYYNFEFTDKPMNFTEFNDKTFDFGKNNVTEYPYLYSTY